MKIEKILVPVDGSDHSMRAAGYAADLAGVLKSELLLIYCHKPFPLLLGEPYFQAAHNRIMKKAHALLDPFRTLFRDRGIDFEERILEGPPGASICRVAGIRNIDMVVMGSRGCTDFEGLLLGSITHRVLHAAPCPVLVVR
jgi:nucleotide-binding universal stress UspA family protein